MHWQQLLLKLCFPNNCENCTSFPRKQWLIHFQLFALQQLTLISTMDNVHRMSTAVCVTY